MRYLLPVISQRSVTVCWNGNCSVGGSDIGSLGWDGAIVLHALHFVCLVGWAQWCPSWHLYWGPLSLPFPVVWNGDGWVHSRQCCFRLEGDCHRLSSHGLKGLVQAGVEHTGRVVLEDPFFQFSVTVFCGREWYHLWVGGWLGADWATTRGLLLGPVVVVVWSTLLIVPLGKEGGMTCKSFNTVWDR